MLDWSWENLPKLLGIAGFFLAAFNQWSIWKERRERKAADAPRGRFRDISVQPDGQAALSVLFKNTRNCRLLLMHAEIVSPKGYGLVIPSQSDDAVSAEPRRQAAMSWTVISADEHEGQSNGRFFAVPLPDASSAVGSSTAGEAIRWEIVFSGEEISPRRRKIKIPVTAIAKPDVPLTKRAAPRSKVRSKPWLGIRRSD